MGHNWVATGCVPKAQSSAHPPYCKNKQNKTLKTQLVGHYIYILKDTIGWAPNEALGAQLGGHLIVFLKHNRAVILLF
jgi:hypothetical protein